MAVEPRRGCGYRKVGGLYLVGGGMAAPCGKLPLPLSVCPACGGGIKPSRGFTWVNPSLLFLSGPCGDSDGGWGRCNMCPLLIPSGMGSSAGLLWCGERFYPTPEHFELEARTMGVSRRINCVPRGFEIGKTWVLMAHRLCRLPTGIGAAVFYVFLPRAVEIVLVESARNTQLEQTARDDGLTPVFVPDSDTDHFGSAYDEVTQTQLGEEI